MSKTKKGSKGIGYEYWGKRAGTAKAGMYKPGKKAKKLTHKMERKEAKKLTKEKE